jgi:signal transduction histidine kinase
MNQGIPSLGWYSRQGYFSKFVVAFVSVVILVLAINDIVEAWFVKRQTTDVASKSLSDNAQSAAQRVEQYMSAIERQISWATRASTTTVEQRRADFALLLQQIPAIDRLIYLDGIGREQLRSTRQETVVESNLDYSGDARFKEGKGNLVWWSPIYFDGRNPFVAVAFAHSGQTGGSTIADINLKFLGDLINPGEINGDTHVYVVDARGRLLADSDASRLLGTDLTSLPQVDARSNQTDLSAMIGQDLNGRSMLSGTAPIPAMNWYVFSERPLSVVLLPMYSLLYRSTWLLALCISFGVVAGTLLARRLVTPIRALQDGARQLERSNFDHRIKVQTSDEIGEVAQQFNRMADQLQNSYEQLEQKVNERTRDLAQSNSELKALEEIGRAVISSLDIDAVLTTIVTRAVELSRADAGAMYDFDATRRMFHLAKAYTFDGDYQKAVVGDGIKFDKSVLGLAATQRQPISIPDVAHSRGDLFENKALAAGLKSMLVIPLLKQDQILGALVLQRRAAEEFPRSMISLMQTFADQSVLAMSNARLFRELEQKGRQLTLASEHKSQFFANMSHELRTPLNAVLGFAELLADGLYGTMPERATEILELIRADGKHLLGLINDVLDLSKIEAGELTLALDDYSVEGIVHSVVASTSSLASAKGLNVTAALEEHLPVGRGDQRRLTQVLINLVGNAIKFTETGSIDIGVKAVGGQFDIAVSDTGPGIAPEDQERIFEEFHQVDNSSTRKKGGTGLGLSISRSLIELHGGRIDLESTMGVGSTFRVIIPVRVMEQKR